jgi:hypothetical protein
MMFHANDDDVSSTDYRLLNLFKMLGSNERRVMNFLVFVFFYLYQIYYNWSCGASKR